MKNKHYSIIAVLLFFGLTMSVCSAQMYYSADNRMSIDIPDNWLITRNIPSDTRIQNIFFAKRKDLRLAVTFDVLKEPTVFNTLSDMPATDREVLCNKLTDELLNNVKAQGFSAVPIGKEVNEHVLLTGVGYTQNQQSYVVVNMYFIRDNYLYQLAYESPVGKQYVGEAVRVMYTATMDGIPLNEWIP